jgi:hypothetical protein
MAETPKFEIDEPVNVNSDDQVFPGTVLGIQYVVPVWYYVIALVDSIESDYGPQKGIFVPESSLSEYEDSDEEDSDEEDSDEAEPNIIESKSEVVGYYVYACSQDQVNEGFPDAIDVEVRLVHDDTGKIYIQTSDEIDGTSFWDNIPYDTEEVAKEVALRVISENHEAEPGEDARSYLRRITDEEEEQD